MYFEYMYRLCVRGRTEKTLLFIILLIINFTYVIHKNVTHSTSVKDKLRA